MSSHLALLDAYRDALAYTNAGALVAFVPTTDENGEPCVFLSAVWLGAPAPCLFAHDTVTIAVVAQQAIEHARECAGEPV